MTSSTKHGGLHATLGALERSVEIPASSDLYGWLAGSWHLWHGEAMAFHGAHGRLVP